MNPPDRHRGHGKIYLQVLMEGERLGGALPIPSLLLSSRASGRFGRSCACGGWATACAGWKASVSLLPVLEDCVSESPDDAMHHDHDLKNLENSFHLLDTYYVSVVVGTGKLCICIISFHLIQPSFSSPFYR